MSSGYCKKESLPLPSPLRKARSTHKRWNTYNEVILATGAVPIWVPTNQDLGEALLRDVHKAN